MDIGPCGHSCGPTCEPFHCASRASSSAGPPSCPSVRQSPPVILSRFDRPMVASLEYVRITHRNLFLPWFADKRLHQRHRLLSRASTARLASLQLPHRSWIHSGFELAQPATTQSRPCPGSIHLTDPQQLPPLFLRPFLPHRRQAASSESLVGGFILSKG